MRFVSKRPLRTESDIRWFLRKRIRATMKVLFFRRKKVRTQIICPSSSSVVFKFIAEVRCFLRLVPEMRCFSDSMILVTGLR